MKNISITKILRDILIYTLSFSFIYGLFILPILSSIFKDNFLIVLVIYIFAMFVIAVVMELKGIKQEFANRELEIVREKEKLEKEYKSLNNDVNKKCEDLRKQYEDEKESLINSYNATSDKLDKDYKELARQLEVQKQGLYKILNDEKIYKPYLAEILSAYKYEIDCINAKKLASKKVPALKASEQVREYAKENRELLKKLKIREHQMLVYESLFPWLEEFKEIPEEEINNIIKSDMAEGYDRVKDFLSPEEYNKLEDCQKYQLWLDRYRAKTNKTNWEIGIDFERYVGYKYEMEGYKIIFNGAREGLEDLGRDLIATKGNNILVIQCKNWSKNKTIHEKHIFQLYGTMVLKAIEEPNKKIKGIFICTTSLSDKAREVAKHLNIEVLENYNYDRNYPCIKCNISRKDGSKIYHLPFDQQYDRIDVEINRQECYVATVKEAEELGFRKAMKHTIY